MSNGISLLKTRKFLPLFATQFLGAFNDNFYKNAILMFIMFTLADASGIDAAMMMPLGAGLFILPFFLFSATAGQIADRYEKAKVIRYVKATEIAVMALGAGAILTESVWGMMAVLFLMGTQSAFFGPLKYGVLPELLRENELVSGNAIIESGTFLSILFGTIAGGILIAMPEGQYVVAVSMVALAVAGWASSLAVPSTGKSSYEVKIGLNIVKETVGIMKYARKDRALFLSILGISWFWLVGAIFLAQFPTFAKEVVGGNEAVVTMFMTIFSIGIGIGSFACDRMLKGEVSAKFVPLASIGIAIFSTDLYFASTAFSQPSPDGLMGVAAFLSTFAGIRVVFDLLMVSVCGGIYVVPLFAFMQNRAEGDYRARVVAANNVLNALFMVAGSVAVIGMLAAGATIPDVFLAVAAASCVVAVYICGILPQALFRSIAAWAFRRLFDVEVIGRENFAKAGDKAVIVANHVSWLDGPLMAAFGPEDAVFPINTHVFSKWWGGLSKLFANMIPVDPTNPMSTKTMVRAVEGGKKLIIFPEGRLTVTGGLMKVYDGPALVADKAKAKIVPVKLEGVQFAKLSRLKGKMPLRWFPKITIRVLEPVELDVPEEARGRERRRIAGSRLYDVMSDMMFATRNTDTTLFNALLDTSATFGGKHPVLEDIETMSRPVPYDRVALGSLILGRKLSAFTEKGENVGVMLPNSVGTVVTFFALQAFGRVPAMLNFSTGADNMISAIGSSGIKTVVTSRRFIDKAKLGETAERLSGAARIVYLEDVKESIGLFDKLLGKLSAPFARNFAGEVSADSPAVVLFTSGSEGTPKGVVLSHRNLLSNMSQLGARIAFNPSDKVFNALPVFHSFGMLGGMLLPIMSGIKTFMYPSPLHYRIVPELCYDTNATVIFGTDTFLSGYARMANPYDFYSVRYVIAGAEKVKDETRKVWSEKFGLRILEGYGATETSPALSINTPMHYKAGTVGRVLPGIEVKLERVPGVDEGQRLLVKGPNVMVGYYKADKPGVIQPPEGGWYDTGDIVSIDSEGYVKIVGRAKRFVKVAGEMVSLSAVESAASAVWPDSAHAAVGLPDARKGEQVVLLTDKPGAERTKLLAYARSVGMSELMVPKTVLVVEKVPVLGSGKTDYVAATKIASEAAEPSAKAAE